MNINWLLITGDLINGYRYHGPFCTKKAAYEYADYLNLDSCYWVTQQCLDRIEDFDEHSDSRHPLPDQSD